MCLGHRRKLKSGTFGSPDGVYKTSREENGTSSGCHGILRMSSSEFSKDVILLFGYALSNEKHSLILRKAHISPEFRFKSHNPS